jgi:hypothetical protein
MYRVLHREFGRQVPRTGYLCPIELNKMQCCKAEPDASCFPVPDYSRSSILNRLLNNGDGFEQFEHAFYPRDLAAALQGEAAPPSASIPAHVFFSRYAPEPTLPPARKASRPAPRAWRGNVACLMSVSLWLAVATSDVNQASDAAAEPAPTSQAHGPQAGRFAFAGPAWRDYDLAAQTNVPRARLRALRSPPSRVADAGGADPLLTRLAVQYAIELIPARYEGGQPAADRVVPTSLARGGTDQTVVRPHVGKVEQPWSTITKVHTKAKPGPSAAQREHDRQVLAELIVNTGTSGDVGQDPPRSVAVSGDAVGAAVPLSSPRPAGTGRVMEPPARLLGGPVTDTASPRGAKRGRAKSEARHVHRAKYVQPRAMASASDQPPQRNVQRSERTLLDQLFANPN